MRRRPKVSFGSRWALSCLAALSPLSLQAQQAPAQAAAPAATAADTQARSLSLPAVLSLRTALELFRERGFDLLLADANLESVRGDQLIASSFANPSVSASIGHSFGYQVDPACSGCSVNAFSAGISDSAVLFDLLMGKRRLRVAVAQAALAAARSGRADAQRTLELALKQQYFTALIARANHRFAGEAHAAFQRTRELNQKRLALGAISDADLAKIDVAALEAEQTRDQADQALRVAKAQLAFLLGAREMPTDFELDDKLLEAPAARALEDAKPEELVRQARERRPDRAALHQQVERAQASIELARRQRWPDVTLGLSYAQEGTGPNAISPPTVTFSASLPVPIFYRQSGEILKAEADLRTQSLTLAKIDAQIVNDVTAGFAQLSTTRKLVARMQQGGLLARARRARDLIEVQYQKGAASLLDLLDAERTYIASHNEYVQDLGNYWMAVAQLEQAVGGELPQ